MKLRKACLATFAAACLAAALLPAAAAATSITLSPAGSTTASGVLTFRTTAASVSSTCTVSLVMNLAAGPITQNPSGLTSIGSVTSATPSSCTATTSFLGAPWDISIGPPGVNGPAVTILGWQLSTIISGIPCLYKDDVDTGLTSGSTSLPFEIQPLNFFSGSRLCGTNADLAGRLTLSIAQTVTLR